MSSTRSVAVRARAGAGPASVVDAALRSSRSAESAAGEHGLGDAGERHAQAERVDGGPGAGALLLGLVDDHVDQRAAGRRRRSWRAPSR